jgi:hypothetical protein
MAERVTVKRAAELTGLSELSVRYGIEQGTLPIGSCIKRSEKKTLFHVSPYLLAQYLGLTVEEVKGGQVSKKEERNSIN